MAPGARSRREFMCAGVRIGRRSALGLMAGGAAMGLARANPTLPLMPAALTMATGEPGGGFALFGPAWGIAAQKGTRIAVSYRASGGSAANILLVQQGAAQLGMTALAVAAQAWNGHTAWTGNVPLRGFRALCPIFETTLQIFAPIGGAVQRLADLAGARIGIGPAGGAGAVLIPAMLAAAGVSPRIAITGLYAEQVDLLRKGQLDACAFFGMTPLPAIRAAAARGSFTMVGFTRKEQATMGRIVPGLMPAVLPATSLPGQSAPVATIGSGAIAICQADLPDALAGRLTDAALTHRAALIGTLPGVTLPNGAWIDGNIPIEIHPGAAAALRRHGLEAPARLIRS